MQQTYALTQLQADGAVGGDYLVYNGTEWGPSSWQGIGRAWQQDDLTSQVTGSPPPTSYTLTYEPVAYSERVHLRTKTLVPGTDYTLSGRTLSIQSTQTLIANDPLFVDYQYLAQTPTAPVATIYVNASPVVYAGASTVTVSLPSGVVNGDLLVAYGIGSKAWGAPTGWTQQYAAAETTGAEAHEDSVFTKTANSEPSSYSFTVASGSSPLGAIVIVAYRTVTSIGAKSDTAVTTNVQSITATPPTPQVSGSWWLWLASAGTNTQQAAFPISVPSPLNARVQTSDANTYWQMLVADEPNAAATSRTFSVSESATNTGWIWHAYELRLS